MTFEEHCQKFKKWTITEKVNREDRKFKTVKDTPDFRQGMKIIKAEK